MSLDVKCRGWENRGLVVDGAATGARLLAWMVVVDGVTMGCFAVIGWSCE